MTANDVNVVIDNIASKLGLAASGMADFVPELARYAIAQDIIAAVISARSTLRTSSLIGPTDAGVIDNRRNPMPNRASASSRRPPISPQIVTSTG